MAGYLRPRNWERFQHYQSGKNAAASARWMKLYTSILDDYEFLAMTEAQRGQLMLLWALAARSGGKIPNDSNFLRAKILSKDLDLAFFIQGGWLEPYNPDAQQALESPSEEILGTHPRNVLGLREEKRREEEIREQPPLSPPPPPAAAPAAPSPPLDTRRDATAPDADRGGVVMEFPCRGNQPVYRLREADIPTYTEAYPGIDVLAEFAKALAWLRTNPTRRKTARGMPAFLNNWLSRCADRPRGSPQGAGTRGGPARFTPRSAFDESVVRPEDRRFVE